VRRVQVFGAIGFTSFDAGALSESPRSRCASTI
jgi:hypothetical protein